MLRGVVIALAGSAEAYTLAGAPQAGSRVLSPQMMAGNDAALTWYYPPQETMYDGSPMRYSPAFGDNTFARRNAISAQSGAIVPVKTGNAANGWYYPAPETTSDAFEPHMGDNMYARRNKLSTPGEGTISARTSDAASSWYYPEPERTSDAFEPHFGDNTYARRRSLGGR